jgi:hypothetical protein
MWSLSSGIFAKCDTPAHCTLASPQALFWTHKIDGLTESDFVFAAKADGQLNTASGPESAGNA